MKPELIGNYFFCKLVVYKKTTGELSEELAELIEDDSEQKEVNGCISLENVREFFEGEDENTVTVYLKDGIFYEVLIKFSEFSKYFKKYLSSKNIYKFNN